MEKDLPVYQIIIPEDNNEEFGVKVISIVDDPAIQEDFIYLNKTQLFTFNADQKILLGPLLIPNKKIFRFSEEIGEYYIVFSEEVITQIVKKFNKEGNHNNLNFQHMGDKIVSGFLQENWIIEDEQFDKSKKYKFNLPKGTWMGKIYIDDNEFWNEIVKTGVVKGFSVELFAGIEQVFSKVNEVCNLENGCGCKGKKGCGHSDQDWDFVEEVMIRAELLKQQYQQDLDSGKLNFRRVKWERWVANDDCLSCPICTTLHNIGWQIQGSFFDYNWGSNTKKITMPRRKKAHSYVGEGRWKADDASCRCRKDTFITDATNPNLPNFERILPCE
jgi:hypothetical protein